MSARPSILRAFLAGVVFAFSAPRAAANEERAAVTAEEGGLTSPATTSRVAAAFSRFRRMLGGG